MAWCSTEVACSGCQRGAAVGAQHCVTSQGAEARSLDRRYASPERSRRRRRRRRNGRARPARCHARDMPRIAARPPRLRGCRAFSSSSRRRPLQDLRTRWLACEAHEAVSPNGLKPPAPPQSPRVPPTYAFPLLPGLLRAALCASGRQLWGGEFSNSYVADGSASNLKQRNLDAAQLTPALRRQTADCRGWRGSARSGCSPSAAFGTPHRVSSRPQGLVVLGSNAAPVCPASTRAPASQG